MNGMDSISPQVFLNRYMDLCIVGRVRDGSRTPPVSRRHYEGASRQGHRIKIGELGRMADPAFGENLSFCGTSSHLFMMFAFDLVIINKYK